MISFFGWRRFLTTSTKLALAAIVFAAWSSPGFAADVKRKLKKKRVIVISEGIPSGFVKKAKVCFYDGDTKVGCGKVRRARKKSSFVRVKKSVFKKIKKGMEARLDGAEGAMADAGDMAKDKAEKAVTKAMSSTNMKLLYVLSVLPVATYKKLSYNVPPSTITNPETLWTQAEDSGMALVGLAAEFEFSKMALGLRYRLYREFLAEANYSNTQSNVYVESSQSASAFGVYFDYYVTQLSFGSSMAWRIATGLDIDISSHEFSAVQLDDNDASVSSPIASASTSDMVVSLRLNLPFQMKLGGVSFLMGPNILIPIFDSPSVSAEVPDSNANTLAKPATDDLTDAIAHGKASFGFEFNLGAQIDF